MTTLLKVYIKGGLFDRSRELLSELESAGYAENEVIRLYYFFSRSGCIYSRKEQYKPGWKYKFVQNVEFTKHLLL
jgi:hypothetical protein